MGIKHAFASTIADGGDATLVRPSNWNADHTIDGTVTLSSGVASSAPLMFVPGSLLSTSTVGAMEMDAKCLYLTAQTSARQLVVTEQIITQTSAYTSSTSPTAQKIFDASAAGAVTLATTGAYFFESNMNFTQGTSTRAVAYIYSLGGTVTIDRVNMMIWAKLNTASSTPTAPVMAFGNSTLPTVIAASSVNFERQIYIRGKLAIGTTGTLIPQLSRTVTGTVAFITQAGSYFRIWPIGDINTNRIGHWS